MTHLVLLRSLATPMGFTRHPLGFAPELMSSQILGFGLGCGCEYGGGGVVRTTTGSSRFLAVRYEFDVEGMVDRVSELSGLNYQL